MFGSRVRVESVAKVAELEAAEKLKMKQKVEKIVAYGINVFINRQLIYNFPEQLFADAGIMAIEHADFEGIERLALLLGISSMNDTIEWVCRGRDRVHFRLARHGEIRLVRSHRGGDDW